MRLELIRLSPLPLKIACPNFTTSALRSDSGRESFVFPKRPFSVLFARLFLPESFRDRLGRRGLGATGRKVRCGPQSAPFHHAARSPACWHAMEASPGWSRRKPWRGSPSVRLRKFAEPGRAEEAAGCAAAEGRPMSAPLPCCISTRPIRSEARPAHMRHENHKTQILIQFVSNSTTRRRGRSPEIRRHQRGRPPTSPPSISSMRRTIAAALPP